MIFRIIIMIFSIIIIMIPAALSSISAAAASHKHYQSCPIFPLVYCVAFRNADELTSHWSGNCRCAWSSWEIRHVRVRQGQCIVVSNESNACH